MFLAPNSVARGPAETRQKIGLDLPISSSPTYMLTKDGFFPEYVRVSDFACQLSIVWIHGSMAAKFLLGMLLAGLMSSGFVHGSCCLDGSGSIPWPNYRRAGRMHSFTYVYVPILAIYLYCNSSST